MKSRRMLLLCLVLPIVGFISTVFGDPIPREIYTPLTIKGNVIEDPEVVSKLHFRTENQAAFVVNPSGLGVIAMLPPSKTAKSEDSVDYLNILPFESPLNPTSTMKRGVAINIRIFTKVGGSDIRLVDANNGTSSSAYRWISGFSSIDGGVTSPYSGIVVGESSMKFSIRFNPNLPDNMNSPMPDDPNVKYPIYVEYLIKPYLPDNPNPVSWRVKIAELKKY